VILFPHAANHPLPRAAPDPPLLRPIGPTAPDIPCTWLHARLEAYNGAPTLRLFQLGTQHVFGLGTSYEATHHCPHCNPNAPDLPPNVDKVFIGFKNVVIADFQVCPLQALRPGHMQPARIIAAKNLIIQPAHALQN